jgi:septum site-determining protein MinC
MPTALEIKGIGDGLLVQVPHGAWQDAQPALLQAIDERADFFRGARLVLQLADREVGAAELGGLRDALAQRDIGLSAVLSTSRVTREAGANLGLELELPTPSTDDPQDELEPIETGLVGEEAVLMRRTLRSGQTLRHPGHVIILGDVNPGAEIIAGGHVVVWGRMRGVVHAGAAGDESAMVCALDLAPTQLRIAGHIGVSPEREGASRPEMAHVRDGQLIAESWLPEKAKETRKDRAAA